MKTLKTEPHLTDYLHNISQFLLKLVMVAIFLAIGLWAVFIVVMSEVSKVTTYDPVSGFLQYFNLATSISTAVVNDPEPVAVSDTVADKITDIPIKKAEVVEVISDDSATVKNDSLVTVTSKRNEWGTQSTDVIINGKSMSMVVDTGADTVALPSSVAVELGLKCDQVQKMQMAQSVGTACLTNVKTVQIGDIVLHDVLVSYTPGIEGMALLGQSALSRLKVEQSNGVMHLSSL